LDGPLPILQRVTTSSPKQESEKSPPSRTLPRSKSIQPTNRPKLDPPGVLSTASYLPSEHPHLNSSASEQPIEARQPVTGEKESTRKVKRSQSLQLTKRPPPAPISATFPTSEKTKGKAAKSKRGHGSVSFVESPFRLELDGVERIKSHSSSSSRTSCSTAGTATSSSQSNDDYGCDDEMDGATAADAGAAAAVLKPLTA
jgi:hypothetical protein